MAIGGSDRIEAHHDAVMAALGPGRDATIEEVRASLGRQGLAFGFGTIQRFFARHAIHAQKKTAHATEQDRPDVLTRRGRVVRGSARPRTRPVGVHRRDLGIHQHGPPPRGLPRGKGLRVGVPHGHWKTTTFVGALTVRGFIAP